MTTPVTTDFGSYSPAAVKNAVVPARMSRAGLACTPGLLILLGNNKLQAKFTSDNVFKLKNGTNTINYTVSADAAGTYPVTHGTTFEYLQNNLLNLLGLLGGSSADLPFYVKPSSATVMPIGTYTDKIKIEWTYYLCTGIGALGACIGTLDEGTATTTINVSLNVEAKNITLTTTTSTTWDPVNGTTNPKSLPGGRKRMAIAVANPDLVAADNNSLALNVPIPAGTMLALDGDGTSSTFLQMADGNPSAALVLVYTSPSSTSDDVDFSSDNGASWTYVPVAGNDASQAAVTNMRLRARGAMAAGSSATVSIPLKTK